MRRGIGGLRAGGSIGFNPATSGLSLTWFDPSDFTSEFQDNTGVTPVTAVTQPVGLLLDKGLSLALSAELITVAADRDFSSDTGFWSKDPGVTIGGGAANWAGTAAVFQLFRTLFLTVGKYYEVTYSVTAYTLGGIKLGGGLAGTTRSAVGTYTERLCATSTTMSFSSVGASTTLSIDNVSFKEVTGNHMTQATAGSRPLVQQPTSFLATKSDGLDDFLASVAGGGGTAGFFYCAAINPSAIGANQTLWADTGTNTGYRVRLNATNQLELAAGNNVAFTTVATVATVTTGTTYVVMAWHDGVNLNVQINSNAVASTAFGTTTAGTAAFTDAASNGGASGFFNGYLFNRIYKKDSALTSAQRAQVQQFIANGAGVTL